MFPVAILLLSLSLSGVPSEASRIAPLQRRSLVVPLQRRTHGGWRRHLLRSGSLSVHGAVRELGYFYVTLQLGTPSRTFNVIIDTGSTMTYVPCKGCAHCGQHQSGWFDPANSSTAVLLGCGDKRCACGAPACTCEANRCYYRRSYVEGSSSQGWLLEDKFRFPDGQPPVNLVFGCENGETGEIYRQMADGLVGMGNSENAFQSQLVAKGVIEDVFSLCFGYPRDGIMLLGDVKLPEGAATVFTPLLSGLHRHFYNVRLEGISVGQERLPLDAASFNFGYGVVLDSGTTFTYLPTVAFNAMAKAIGDRAAASGLQSTPGADPQYKDICWKGLPHDSAGLASVLPTAEFVFGGGAAVRLPPRRYLFAQAAGEYCLSIFDNGMSGTLIGSGSMQDVVVTYDRRNSRVGFTDMPCAEVAEKLGAAAPAAAPKRRPAPSPATTATTTTTTSPGAQQQQQQQQQDGKTPLAQPKSKPRTKPPNRPGSASASPSPSPSPKQ